MKFVRTGEDFLDPIVQVPAITDSGIVASFTLVVQSPSTDLSYKLILTSSIHLQSCMVPHKGLMLSSSDKRNRKEDLWHLHTLMQLMPFNI